MIGTSLTFYRGRAFNQSLTAQVKKAVGVPVTTMSTGIVDGRRAAKAKRIAVATAHNVEVTDRRSQDARSDRAARGALQGTGRFEHA